MAAITNLNLGQTRGFPAVSAVKLSDEAARSLKEITNPPEPPPVGRVKANNDPSEKYATLERDGKTIATFYKNGGMHTPNDILIPDDLKNDGAGTSLSDARIKQMMALHGGNVKYMQDILLQNSSEAAATLFAVQLAGQ